MNSKSALALGAAAVAMLLLSKGGKASPASPAPGSPAKPGSAKPKVPVTPAVTQLRWFLDGAGYANILANHPWHGTSLVQEPDGKVWIEGGGANISATKDDSCVDLILYPPNGEKRILLLEVFPPYRAVWTESARVVYEFCSLLPAGGEAPFPERRGRFAIWIGDSATLSKVLTDKSGVKKVRWYDNGPSYWNTLRNLNWHDLSVPIDEGGGRFWIENGGINPDEANPSGCVDLRLYPQGYILLLEIFEPYRSIRTKSTDLIRDFCAILPAGSEPAFPERRGRFAIWLGDSATLSKVLAEL